jgi:hypothetical protein
MTDEISRDEWLKVVGGIITLIAATALLLAWLGKYIFPPIGLAVNIALHGTIGTGIAISAFVVTLGSVCVTLVAFSTTIYTLQIVVKKASDSKYKYDAFVPIFSTLGGIFAALGKEAYQPVFSGYAAILFAGAVAITYAIAGIWVKREGVGAKVGAIIFYIFPPAMLLGFALGGHMPLNLQTLRMLAPSIQISIVLLILLTISGLLVAYKAGKPE